MNKTLCAALAAAGMALASAAASATYTYTINYDFPILRTGNNLGAFAKPVVGRGGVTGSFTIDDTFETTRAVLSYALTTTNTAGWSNVSPSYSFSSTDPTDSQSFSAPTGPFDPAFRLNFTDVSSATPCSAGLIGNGSPYQVAGSRLSLHISRNFRAGDASFSMRATENFGRTSYCNGRLGYPINELEHTAPNTGFLLAGTLSATQPTTGAGTGTGSGTGTGGGTPAAVPLPAGLPLILAGLGALGLVRRKRR